MSLSVEMMYAPKVDQRDAWWKSASCYGLWELYDHEPRGLHLQQMKTICDNCPVKRQCLHDQMEHEGGTPAYMRKGVYGGKSPIERYRLYEQQASGE